MKRNPDGFARPSSCTGGSKYAGHGYGSVMLVRQGECCFIRQTSKYGRGKGTAQGRGRGNKSGKHAGGCQDAKVMRCFRCNYGDHIPRDRNCPGRNKKCNTCGEVGDFAIC